MTGVEEILAEVQSLQDPKVLAINQRHGDDHGVKLSELRTIAKRLKAQPELARELWTADDTAAQLLAILVSRPSNYSADQLDAMLREARAPKVRDWLLANLVKKSRHMEDLRLAWLDDPNPTFAGAGWHLTSVRVAKGGDGLDLPAMLDTIEADMKTAPADLQWSMNETLAQIGINNPDLRERAIAIGERLEVLKDYPTPPNCTSPYAPIWITEMVRRASS